MTFVLGAIGSSFFAIRINGAIRSYKDAGTYFIIKLWKG